MNLLLFAADLPELSRGRWSAPAWLVVILACLIVAGAVAYLVKRARRTHA